MLLREGIAKLLLSYALASNPNGVVVCGMHENAHIERNAALAGSAPRADGDFWNAINDIRQSAMSIPNESNDSK
jgi:hypothetical protein